MQAYKARGGKLGSARPGHWKGREHLRLAGLQRGRPVAVAAVKRQADEFASRIGPRILAMQAEGLTPSAIAVRLNTDGIPTQRGVHWGGMGVRRVLQRFQTIGS